MTTHRDLPLRLLLLVTGRAIPEVEGAIGTFEDLFRRGLSRGPLPYVLWAVDAASGERCPPLGRYDGILVTGSPARVGDRAPWMLATADVMAEAVAREIPLLGVCFGHQLLGVALGADVGPNPPGYGVGTTEMRLLPAARGDALLGDLPPSLPVNHSHLDAVRIPGERLTPVGVADHDACFAMRAGPVAWGLQFHPEFDGAVTRAYIEARREVVQAHHGEGATEARLRAVADTPTSAALLPRFAHIAARRREGC